MGDGYLAPCNISLNHVIKHTCLGFVYVDDLTTGGGSIILPV